MEAGRLRERVTIEKETRVSNGQGGWETGWSTVASLVPAEVIALSGDEALKLGIERASVQYRVRLRRRRGLTAANRLQWKGETMAIHSVAPDPKEPNNLFLLSCEIGQGG